MALEQDLQCNLECLCPGFPSLEDGGSSYFYLFYTFNLKELWIYYHNMQC